MLIIETYQEHTTLKNYEDYSVHFYDNLEAGYEILDEKNLPKEYDILSANSFEMFPIEILRGSNMNELPKYSHFTMNHENFEILNRFMESGVRINYERTDYREWFRQKKEFTL